MPFDTNLRNTLLFLALFIFAFFPSAFQLLLKPILLPFTYLDSDFTPPKPSSFLPICGCCPPESCLENRAVEATMAWFQTQFTLPAKARGSYLITDIVTKEVPQIKDYKIGILHLFMQHTSAGLSLNENWDSDVRADMSDALDRIVPQDKSGDLYRHSCEGPDDMPAHVKSALVGASVSVPIRDGRLATGTWQGIWYLEFRAAKHSRRIVATIQGEKS
jgi:secondary thiamine-phosphate synthase enzyme